ncbi:MAG: DUF342 domain-containing protein [Desulfovibrionaceae bacterium]
MPYLLKHFFDPDFDHLHLKPRVRGDGSVDHRDLNYVQNVVRDQVLAEFVEIEAPEDGEEDVAGEGRFVFDEPAFPIGVNCRPDPRNPLRLLASVNGYVFYDEHGKIIVKSLLNVRRDVDYNTGDVVFVGDLVVHGSVRAGFRLRAAGVRVKQTVEGARLTSMGSIVCEGGIKGSGEAVLKATQTIRAGFCENATLVADQNVLIDGPVLHSRIYAGHKLAVKGRLTGGEVYCMDYAYIGGQLGGGIGAATSIVAGYDPLLLYTDQQLNAQIKGLREDLEQLKLHAERGKVFAAEAAPEMESLRRRMGRLIERKSQIWENIHATEALDTCRVMIEGEVKPGVEISIGSAYLRVDDFLRNVCFRYRDQEIVVESPAVKK